MNLAKTYPPPIDQLLTLGETRIHEQRNYLKMGFTHAHIPDLIRLVEDDELYHAEWEDENRIPPQVYAQIHAWRALTQLGAIEAIPAFVGLLHLIDEDEDDFVGEEIPVMLGNLGAPAIEPCRAYLAHQEHGEYARIAAGQALCEIGARHPETRDACVQAMMSTLEDYRNDNETVNAFTLLYLADLKAVEAAPLAEEIFKAGKAELEVAGDYEDFLIAVGLLKKRLTPSPFRRISDQEISRLLKDLGAGKKERAQKQAKKEKNKRKQARKARKRHKKK